MTSDWETSDSLVLSFRAKREIFVIRGSSDDVRKSENRKPVIKKPSGIDPHIFAAKPPPSSLIPHSSFEQSFQTESKERSAPWTHSASGNKKLPILISPCQGRHGKYLKNYSRKFHVGVLASAWDLRHFVMPRISLCISESACFRQSGTVQGSSHSELPCELPLVSLLQIVPENVRNCKNGHIGRWPNAVRRRY